MRVRYDPNFHGTACLQGLWPFRTVVVGQWYMRQSSEAQEAIYQHEMAHAKLFHVEKLLLKSLFRSPQRIWWLEQELEADRWVFERGFGIPLFHVLRRLHLENGPNPERMRRMEELGVMIGWLRNTTAAP